MNHVMRLKKLDQYNPSFLPFEKLKAYAGIKSTTPVST